MFISIHNERLTLQPEVEEEKMAVTLFFFFLLRSEGLFVQISVGEHYSCHLESSCFPLVFSLSATLRRVASGGSGPISMSPRSKVQDAEESEVSVSQSNPGSHSVCTR